jgi:hypothetical protein
MAGLFNFIGQHAQRTDKGTYKMENNCPARGFFTDSLGSKINYVIRP